ncbi:MAG: phenylalanine--tRNA ligase subunit beta, partial [bacterium]
EEEIRFAGVVTGSSTENTWKAKARPFDIFDIKGYVGELLARNGVVNYVLESCKNALTTQKTLCVKKDGELLGLFGEITQHILQQFDIDQAVYLFDFDLGKLTANRVMERKFRPIPKYPPSKRDLAVVVGETVKAEELVKEIEKNGGEFLRSVRLFDVFTGESIGEGKKSLAFNLTFFSLDRTLMDGEVESQIERILDALSTRYSAKLRG